MLFPNKPEILYAPMLSTFGGGSATGFGQGISSGLNLPGLESRLYGVAPAGLVEWNQTNNTVALETTSSACDSAFPAKVSDVAISPDGSAWHMSAVGSTLYATKLGQGNFNTIAQSNIQNGTRAICTLRNGYIAIAASNQAKLRIYSIANNGTLTLQSIITNSNYCTSIESMVSPPPSSSSTLNDKTGLGSLAGSDCQLFVCSGSSGNNTGISIFDVDSTGNITYNSRKLSGHYGALGYYPNGYLFFADHYNNNYAVLDNSANYVINSNQVVSNQPQQISPGGDGHMYSTTSNYRIRKHKHWSDSYPADQLSQYQGNANLTPDYPTALFNQDGYIYVSGFTNNGDWRYYAKYFEGTINGSHMSHDAFSSSMSYTSNSYTLDLIGGRPLWATHDENFMKAGWA